MYTIWCTVLTREVGINKGLPYLLLSTYSCLKWWLLRLSGNGYICGRRNRRLLRTSETVVIGVDYFKVPLKLWHGRGSGLGGNVGRDVPVLVVLGGSVTGVWVCIDFQKRVRYFTPVPLTREFTCL